MSAHEEHVELFPHEWPVDRDMGRATTGKVGMWIFLLSDAFMFGGILLGYGILRGGSDVWIHSGEPILGIGFTAFLTFLLICSSVSMVLSYAALVEKDIRNAKKWLFLTILGGSAFLCGQFKEYFGIQWLGHLVEKLGLESLGHHIAIGLTDEGLILGNSNYANSFYTVTSFHGFHVLTGVTLLSIMLLRLHLGKYDDGNYNDLEIAGLFWHFVDLIWILVFTLVYLL